MRDAGGTLARNLSIPANAEQLVPDARFLALIFFLHLDYTEIIRATSTRYFLLILYLLELHRREFLFAKGARTSPIYAHARARGWAQQKTTPTSFKRAWKSMRTQHGKT